MLLLQHIVLGLIFFTAIATLSFSLYLYVNSLAWYTLAKDGNADVKMDKVTELLKKFNNEKVALTKLGFIGLVVGVGCLAHYIGTLMG